MGLIVYVRYLPDGSSSTSERPMLPLHKSGENAFFDDTVELSDYDRDTRFTVTKIGNEYSYRSRTLSERRHPACFIHFITGGKGYFNGRELGRGDAFVTFPNQPHTMIADTDDPWRFCWVSVRGEVALVLLNAVGISEERDILHFDYTYGGTENIIAIFEDILYTTHNETDMPVLMTGVFLHLLSLMAKESSTASEKSATGKEEYAVAAYRYIEKHYSEPLKIDALADSLHIARKYLCSVFVKKYGMSPQAFLIKSRLECAAAMLKNTSASISEIASVVGYPDYTRLSRLFSKYYGCSPTRYRSICSRDITSGDC